MSRTLPRRALALILLAAACTPRGASVAPAPDGAAPALARQAEIRRTTWGVPQIRAENLAAAGFALAWVMLEDHGDGTIRGINAARGRAALVEGQGRVDADAHARLRVRHAEEAWPTLSRDVRDVYDGFAAGINHYIRVHGASLPAWMEPDFRGVDVLAREVKAPSAGLVNGFVRRLRAAEGSPPLLAVDADGAWVRLGAASVGGGSPPEDAPEGGPPDDVGSNAWALAPSRTTSGHAILLRNPHLSWSAGYYEAHLRVPGVLDFYGDFRVGGPFTTIGGFNPHLGFATTNNAARSHEFYAFRNDPAQGDAILLDGVPVALRADTVEVPWRDPDGSEGVAVRVLPRTMFGPVIHRDVDFTYVVRMAADGDAREGEQWLAMMRARSLGEWEAAMRLGARTTSNFTYADRDGNILLAWMTGAPVLPHPAGGDTVAILAHGPGQVWQRRAPYDRFPRVLNPPGGYVRNENDSPHYTNLRAVLRHDWEFPVEPPRLRFRSQHGIALLDHERRLSLDDVVATKHSPRMLLADRVKPDLLAALAAAPLDAETRAAADLLARWDNSVAVAARGAMLFEVWWERYRALRQDRPLHAVDWGAADPAGTPTGLADPGDAVAAFEWAVPETARRHGGWDVAWGEVNRVRRGRVDAPVSGCGGALGCFRVLTLSRADDGRRVVTGGDGWVIAVEFGEEPRAYSVLAYGMSPDPSSPWHDNQAAMFAAGQMKPVAWSEAAITRATVRRYHPGDRHR